MALISRFILILLLGIAGLANAQNDTIKLSWRKPVPLVINGKYKNILSFEFADHSKNNGYLPSYISVIKGTYSSSVELINSEWAKLTEQDLVSLPEKTDAIGSEPKISFFNSDERGVYNTLVEILPFRKGSSGQVEKLVKFQIRTNPSSPPLESGNNNSQRRLGSITNSVLAQGDWYKLSFANTGIYKIDYNFIKSLGLKPDEINIQNLQLWGNGGGMLPERIADFRKDDLTETPVFVYDGNDGKFDEGDYILCYVQGPNIWKPQSEIPYFSYLKNIYSQNSYYFLTIGNVAGQRIRKEVNSNLNPDVSFSTYTSRLHHEIDVTNFLASGRKWYGEEFDNNNIQSFNFPANSIVPGKSIHIASSFFNKSIQSSTLNSFNLSINGTAFKTYSLYGGGAGVYDMIGIDGEYKDIILSDYFTGQNNLSLTIKYNKVGGVGTGFLDYLSLVFEDDLVVNSNQMGFRHVDSRINGAVQYNLKLSSPSQLRVWDVTDLGNISELVLEISDNAASFKYSSDSTIREFVAFHGNNFLTPVSLGKIGNQNVRGNITPDMLIVTHPLFKEQANKLADFRREHDNLDVVVATTEEIYNEFSSGSQDLVAIRDCARMFYADDIVKFKYILLFGDCSYDYKNIKNLASPQNFVPVYQSPESLDPTKTHSSDDYIGLLSPEEGLWSHDEELEIGIGRIPVKTSEEAEIVIQKIFHYTLNPITLGSWRQNLTFIADNEEQNEFLDNAESLSTSTDVLKNDYNIKKVYLAAYSKDVTGATPEANNVIASEFEKGTFMMNYIGHGGERQLASENIINLSTIAALKNYDKLPFMVTATCDFGRYDDPSLTSGGELFLLSPAGGAIGLLCTTRPVFQNYNRRINGEFYKAAFIDDDSKRRSLRLGDLIRTSKNYTAGGSSIYIRNFALLGDPSLKLSFPKNDVIITKINGKDFFNFGDTLKAQSKVTITGNISNNGAVLTDFNGVVSSLVFDKAFTVTTIDEPLESFEIQESKIFDGSATIKNGEFSFTFIVPRNINYIVGSGKISLYANSEDGRMIDAGGGFSQVLIGGGDNNIERDVTPPQVKTYLNDESFVQNGITNENPLLIIKLSDENGISSIGDIGGHITYTLSDRPGEEVILDNYYKSDRDTYKSGTIKYRLSNLEEGPKWIKVKAFDSNKNKNGEVIEFVVAKHGNLKIDKLLNYPNPFTTNTVFHFDHNRAGDDLDILLQVFTITGKLVKSLSLHTPSASTHISDLVWDGKDEYGDNIGRGVYVYKLSVKALSDGTKKDEYQKLVILN